MKAIASRDNPLFKSLAKWASAQGRGDAPVLLEGAHVCQSWIDVFGQPQWALFDESRLADARLADLVAQVDDSVAVTLPARLLAQLADAPSDQGVRFVVQVPRPALPEALADNAVLLDRVQDPGNVGTILRACAATGVADCLLSAGCASAWSPKVLRSAQGAHFAVRIHEHCDLAEVIGKSRVPVLATTLQASQDLYAAALPERAAWLFGHEGQGVNPALAAVCAQRIRIDHDRRCVDSLNVAMAATLCLFDHRRRQASQRRG